MTTEANEKKNETTTMSKSCIRKVVAVVGLLIVLFVASVNSVAVDRMEEPLSFNSMPESEEFLMEESAESDIEPSNKLVNYKTTSKRGKAASQRMSERSSGASSMGADFRDTLNKAMEEMPRVKETNRMLVHNGRLDMYAPRDAVSKIDTLVGDGYAESKNVYESRVEWTWRIRSSIFHETVARIRDLADHVVSMSIHTRDVTDGFVDATSRANTLEASRNALQTLLERAQSVEEILRVQSELNHLTQEHESHKARAMHLQKEADWSTLTLIIREKGTKGHKWWSPTPALKRALQHMSECFGVLGDALVYSMVWAVPILMICCLVYVCLPKNRRTCVYNTITTCDMM